MDNAKCALVAILAQQQRLLDLEQEIKNKDEFIIVYKFLCEMHGYEVVRCDDCPQVFSMELGEHSSWGKGRLCEKCRQFRRQIMISKAFQEGRVSVRQ